MMGVVTAIIAESDRWQHLDLFISNDYHNSESPEMTPERTPISSLSCRSFHGCNHWYSITSVTSLNPFLFSTYSKNTHPFEWQR